MLSRATWRDRNWKQGELQKTEEVLRRDGGGLGQPGGLGGWGAGGWEQAQG